MPDERPTMYVTLGSHLDLFWMGTHDECLDKGTKLSRIGLDLMETDPEYCYYIETTVFADYHLRKYPEDKQRMQRFLEEGRLEIGGCYVDRLEQIHDGESLIRHATLGVKWMRDTFGIQPTTVAHPDLPGMSPQVPQIYAKAGIRAYLMARGVGFIYNWIGPDGSDILFVNLWGYGNKKKIENFERPLLDPDRPNKFIIRGGYGDLEPASLDVLDTVRALREKYPAVAFQFASPGKVLEDIPKESVPAICGEMPFGWGSIPAAYVRLLQLNSELEHLLLSTERWMTIAHAQGFEVAPADVAEPTGPILQWWGRHRSRTLHHDPIPSGQEMNELWLYALFTQDHNYGGIHGAQSNFDKAKMMEYAILESKRWLQGSVNALQSRLQPAKETILAYNSQSWQREEIVVIPESTPEILKMVDGDGCSVPSQRTKDGLAVQLQVPAMGYSAYTVERGLSVGPKKLIGNHLVGGSLRAVVDIADGCVSSLQATQTGRELTEQSSSLALGEIVSYEDPGVAVRYQFTGNTTSDRNGGYALIDSESGDLFDRITVGGTFLDCHVEKEFTLYKNSSRLDVTVRIFWWGKIKEHVRVCLPFRKEGFRETWYGVPFAATRWPDMLQGASDDSILNLGGLNTDTLLAEDRRHFREVMGWLDIGYGNVGGIAVTTKSPTFWIDDSLLQAVLLRSQFTCGDYNLWHHNPGRHEWTFRIEPHAGDWRTANVYALGQSQLTPLVVSQPGTLLEPAAGDWRPAGVYRVGQSESSDEEINSSRPLPASYSFLGVSPENVVITALKQSDSVAGAFVVRVLETVGRPTTARIKVAGNVTRAVDVNLLEDKGLELQISDNTIEVELRQYEFKTIQFYGSLD